MERVDDDFFVVRDDGDDDDEFEQTVARHIADRHARAQAEAAAQNRRGGSAARPQNRRHGAHAKKRPKSAATQVPSHGIYTANVRHAGYGASSGSGQARRKRPSSARPRHTAPTVHGGGGVGAGAVAGHHRLRAAGQRPWSAAADTREQRLLAALQPGTRISSSSSSTAGRSAMPVTHSRLSKLSGSTRTRKRPGGRQRPWSAQAPRYPFGSTAPPAAVPHSRRPASGKRFSSAKQLRKAAAKKRAEQAEFAKALLDEEQEQLQAAHARVTQANLWAASLGTGRNYRTTRVSRGGSGSGAGDVETRVIVHDRDGSSRDVSLEIFTREYEKLHEQVRRRQEAQAAEARAKQRSGGGGGGGGGAAMRTPGGQRATSPIRSPPRTAATRKSKTKKDKYRQRVMGHYTHTLNAATAARKRRPNKAEVQAELRQVLKETAQLTQVLEQQLQELRSKGWNEGTRH